LAKWYVINILKENFVDIKKYENRSKFKKLPNDFNHQDAKNFESNWEYCKTLSNYHFDKWKKETEGDWFHYLGKYVGDWNSELKEIIEESRNLGWSELSKKGKHPGFKSGESATIDQENYDRSRMGLSEIEYTNMVLSDDLMRYSFIRSMIDLWSLEKPSVRAHVQMPGQSFILHIDKLWHRNPENPTKIMRLVIHLEDWEPGQIIMYGNAVHIQWKAGDVHIFDTLNVPHCSSNLSDKPRSILIVTGQRTSNTDILLDKADSTSLYYIS